MNDLIYIYMEHNVPNLTSVGSNLGGIFMYEWFQLLRVEDYQNIARFLFMIIFNVPSPKAP